MAHSFSRFVVGAWSVRFSTQAFSQRAGQMRPVNSGKSFVSFSRLYASSHSPLYNASFHSGALLPRGHAQWQKGTPQSMHRDAWRRRSLVLRVCSTSLKSLTRSCNGLYPASTRGTVRNAFGFPIVFFSFGFVGGDGYQLFISCMLAIFSCSCLIFSSCSTRLYSIGTICTKSSTYLFQSSSILRASAEPV